MPVTKTAKRALAASKRKEVGNSRIRANLEIAIRSAIKEKTKKRIIAAISLADRAAKKKVVHKNKAAHIKSTLGKLLLKRKALKSSKKK